ncbi:hypothetical protein SAMN05518865_103157 [Duganella sp. CF458]|uniref:hypothetical protein n=1 Tax=Duganella sp. CF458 TaxID=1884368 RepID=UPI0008EE670C|nr:hypothetical protein [Duganella sp. CF458]SFF68518.1 hypothetical protein SAMN05518865_103157 [Duganella sp. CF458]
MSKPARAMNAGAGPSLWLAMLKGALAAPMLALPVLILAGDRVLGPAPSGYAGTGFGAVVVLFLLAGQLAAAILGAVAGAIWLRKPRHRLMTWSVNVLALLGAAIIGLLSFALLTR